MICVCFRFYSVEGCNYGDREVFWGTGAVIRGDLSDFLLDLSSSLGDPISFLLDLSSSWGPDLFPLGPDQFFEGPITFLLDLHFPLEPDQFFGRLDHFCYSTNFKTGNFIAKRPQHMLGPFVFRSRQLHLKIR